MQDKRFADLGSLERGEGALWGTETEDLDATLVSWSEGKGVDVHTNDEVDVVMVVLEGSGTVARGEESLAVQAGQIVVIPKGTPRSVRAGAGGIAYLNVHKRRRRLMPTGTRPRPA
jgi:mannose-6-phosphate isomerase-like protein (cupin superfamily)